MAEENSLTALLRAGLSVGTAFASQKLFGSEPTDVQGRQQERNFWSGINGSGPPNPVAATAGARSWTDFLFGKPTATQGQALTGNGPTPSALGGLPPILLLAVAGVVAWLVFRRV